MTERKPAGVSFETWVDMQIREAKERGEFENLPGHGKPLADLDGNHDELWWIKQLLRREELSFTPPSLALRKAVEDMLDSVGKLLTERAVRNVVDELNGRIRELNRMPPVDGPPSTLMPLDIDNVLARWRAQRLAIEAAAAELEAAAPEVGPVLASTRRKLFRRQRQ